MRTDNLVEEYFLQVEKLIGDGEFTESKRLLVEILEMEPSYGRAHNHLGWIYFTKFDDFERAENHFSLAIKFAPEYPASYINYVYLLNEVNAQDKVKEIISNALQVKGVRRSLLYNELARSDEMNGDFNSALLNYQNALQYAMNKEEVNALRENIERAKSKGGKFKRKFTILF